jgi:hypothetical protein
MMNLVQRFFSKTKGDKARFRADFAQYFFSMPEHAWITSAKIEGHFRQLFNILPTGVLEALVSKYPISFIPSQQMHSDQQLSSGLKNTVVVFPEFQKLLQSKRASAVAYLAHELAFVLYEHEAPKNDPLMAEVEADKFVCDIGLTFELEELLLMLDETLEKRLRLTYLTARHFSQIDN